MLRDDKGKEVILFYDITSGYVIFMTYCSHTLL